MEEMRFGFSKKERISGKTRIEKMFSLGNAFLSYPFRVVLYIYDTEDNNSMPAILISIPKKRLKRAHDRNRMKRLTKEVYRLNKSLLKFSDNDKSTKQVDIAFIYVCNTLQPYNVVEKGVKKSLREIRTKMTESI